MVSLETARLIVRQFQPDDWRDLQEYASQRAVTRWDYDYPPGDEGIKGVCAYFCRTDGFWAVCLKETGKLIGHVVSQPKQPRELRTWSLGYIFSPSYYGNGYATEACRRVLQYAFETLGAHRVQASCSPDNPASWKLLERLGMRREAHHRKDGFIKTAADGQPIWWDSYDYAILDEEWPSAAPGSAGPTDNDGRRVLIELAAMRDAAEVLLLQKLAYQSEAELYDDYGLAPLVQTLAEMEEDMRCQVVLVARMRANATGHIVGSVRARLDDDGACRIGRLIVHPNEQGRGIGTLLMGAIEARFSAAERFELFTGDKSARNLALYRRLGYAECRRVPKAGGPALVYLEKPAHPSP